MNTNISNNFKWSFGLLAAAGAILLISNASGGLCKAPTACIPTPNNCTTNGFKYVLTGVDQKLGSSDGNKKGDPAIGHNAQKLDWVLFTNDCTKLNGTPCRKLVECVEPSGG